MSPNVGHRRTSSETGEQGGVSEAFEPDDEDARTARQQQQRLLEARVEAAQEGQVREVLAIPVDRDPIGVDGCDRRVHAPLEFGARDLRAGLRYTDIGERDRA